MTRRFKVDQRRGAWVATVEIGVAELGLGADARVPVIVDDRDGRFDWRARRYRTTPDPEHGAWWLRPDWAEWRALLEAGRPVLLRRGLDRETRTAGPKVGLFRFGGYRFGGDAFEFNILERIGEVE